MLNASADAGLLYPSSYESFWGSFLYVSKGKQLSLQQYVCSLGNGNSALVNLLSNSLVNFLSSMNLLFLLGGLLCISN